MRVIRTVDAQGHVLCHDITRIVRGVSKGAAFKKGHIVTKEDIPALLALGKESLFVWERAEGMLHENEAAQILYDLCASAHMHAGPVSEGKIEAIADADGLLQIDTERLRAVNALGGMMIAARRTNIPVRRGEKLAGMRVIPLVIESGRMEHAQRAAQGAPILRLCPYKPKKAAVITTGGEVYGGLIEDTFTPVLREKLLGYGVEVTVHATLPDRPEEITQTILRFEREGADLILCTGGMSVDPDDRTPLAIKNTGARIVSYGAPVLPGAMFLLSYLPSGAVVAGLPGCVMYAGRTIFDLVLPRLLADVPITSDDLAALGHGGLCMDCPVCIFPQCAFGCGL